MVVAAMDSVDYLYFWNRIRQCHFAIDIDKIRPITINNHTKVRIFHAPNHMAIKGSEYIKIAIDQLINEGYDIEYVFEQGKPNDEIIKLIQSSDIVIDQLIMGWHGMFALESMAAGKPTICHIRNDLLNLYENTGCIVPGELPLIDAEPTTIKDVLRHLLDTRDTWEDIGIKSRNYVVKYHSYDAIGAFFDEINRSLSLK